LFLPGHIEQRQQSADVPGQQKQKQQRDVTFETQPGNQAGECEHAHHGVMRRRLDEGDRTRQDRDVKHHQQQALAESGRRHRRHARRHGATECNVLGGDQYAFSILSSANGVRATM
jgi:hypothetical protein